MRSTEEVKTLVSGNSNEMSHSDDLRKTQHELIAERDRLQAIGDNLPNGALIRCELDEKTQEITLTYLSSTWKKLTNLSVEDSLGNISQVFEVIYPEDAPGLMEEIKESFKNLTTIHQEFRFFFGKNDIRWLQLSSHPHKEKKKVISDGFVSDITERKEFEAELDVYRKKLEILVKERSEELKSTNEELVTVNQELAATNEELYATNEELHATNEELYVKNQQLEEEVKRRKMLMQQLENSEKIRKNFIEQSLEGIVIIDHEGKVIEWNDKQVELTGIRKEEAIDQYEWDLIFSRLPNEGQTKKMWYHMKDERQAYLRNIKKNQPIIEERILLMPDGKEKYIKASIFPIALADRYFIGIITHDFTKERKTSKELEHYRNHLEQMVEQKNRELKDSREQLISLSNNLSGGIIFQLAVDMKSKNIQFLFISDTVVDMFGLDSHQVMDSGKSLFGMFQQDARDQLYDYFFLRCKESLLHMESLVKLGAGEEKWIHIRASKRILDTKEEVWEGFMIDISKRKSTEFELEKISLKQAELIDILQIVQFSENLEDAINKALEKIGRFLNISRVYTFVKTDKGKTLRNNYEWCNEGVDPQIDYLQDASPGAVQYWFDVFESGSYICEPDISNLPGDTYDVLVTQGIKSIMVLPLVNNGINYGFIGFEDCFQNREWEPWEINLLQHLSQIVSESILRNWAEKALRQSRQTIHTVLDNINASIYVVDYDTDEILFANKKLKEQIGDDRIEGKQWMQMSYNKRSPVDFRPNISLKDKEKYPEGLLSKEYWSPNTKKWYACTETVINWIDGRKVYMEYLMDITERKKDEVELIRAKEKAEESDKLKSAFLANMSHEIRTPVNGINGFLGFLADDELSPERRREYINIIKNSSAQLVKLIDDIIDVAKIEARQMSIHPAMLNINNLMREVQVFFETSLIARHKEKVTILLDESGFMNDCVIYVDPVRLGQILTNLVNNAVKFTDKGYIRLSYRLKSSDTLEFLVEDTGIGIEKDQLDIIFERFRQVEMTSNRKYGGTGLGLTISKSMAQLMGGDLYVDSIPNEGSTFYFTITYIPIDKEDRDLFKTREEPENGDENRVTVLVVEPQMMKYEYYKDLLSLSGASVLYAGNSREWLDQVSQSEYIDVVMVNSAIFRKDDENIRHLDSIRENLPLVLIVNEQDDKELIRKVNCRKILKEPIRYSQIKEIIELADLYEK
ncbi:MAG: PAS domain S-box protein [Bacteroidales bacterium]|jgi:PAS domain S-box-containing protein|nr:PAS domain S-box protein [Bacteroidales bacterium]